MWRDAEKFLLKDKYIGPLIKKWGHCTIKPRVHKDYFQALCGEIIGQRVKDRKLHIRKLSKLSDEEVKKELVAVKGIGPWTADMFLMFSLGRPDIFPKDDLGINKAMKKLKLKNSNRWKPYRTVASWYLWRSLESG